MTYVLNQHLYLISLMEGLLEYGVINWWWWQMEFLSTLPTYKGFKSRYVERWFGRLIPNLS